MIYGIGTDIFDVKRMKSAMDKDPGFCKSVLSEAEIAYCEKLKFRHQHFAARFSAKEAFLKALGTGWREGISFPDIEVYHDELGKPHIRLHRKAEEKARQLGISRIHVSLSHSRELATAMVILEQ